MLPSLFFIFKKYFGILCLILNHELCKLIKSTHYVKFWKLNKIINIWLGYLKKIGFFWKILYKVTTDVVSCFGFRTNFCGGKSTGFPMVSVPWTSSRSWNLSIVLPWLVTLSWTLIECELISS
jgi:hypothetical protein